jgi:hypothetical protein
MLTREHMTTLRRLPCQWRCDPKLPQNNGTRTNSRGRTLEVVHGPLCCSTSITHSRQLWYAHFDHPNSISGHGTTWGATTRPAVFHLPVACCHNAVVNVQCPGATCESCQSADRANENRLKPNRLHPHLEHSPTSSWKSDMFFYQRVSLASLPPRAPTHDPWGAERSIAADRRHSAGLSQQPGPPMPSRSRRRARPLYLTDYVWYTKFVTLKYLNNFFFFFPIFFKALLAKKHKGDKNFLSRVAIKKHACPRAARSFKTIF